MPSRLRLLPLCAALLAVLSGCASDRLAATAPAGLALSGDWALDPTAGDDLDQVIAQLHEQIDKARHVRWRTGAPGGGFASPARRREQTPAGDADERSDGPSRQSAAPAQPSPGLPRGSTLIQEFLSNVPGSYLRITVAPGSFSVASGNASQEYSPGIQTAVELGQVSAEQISGWKGRQYVIDTKPERGPSMTQSYQLAHGKLLATVRLRGQGIDTTLTLRYERTTKAPAALLPTND